MAPLKMIMFDVKEFDSSSFETVRAKFKEALSSISYVSARLTTANAAQAKGFDIVCAFVNDDLSAPVIDILADCGVKLICMRCAGFDRVDLKRAAEKNIKVVRVPVYSPAAIAEYATSLLLALTRKLNYARDRVRLSNFSIEGLAGININNRVVGVVGTGNIGYRFIKIMLGFEPKQVLCYDVFHNKSLDDYIAKGLVKYVALDELLSQADIVSLHVPLLPATKHMIRKETIAQMKDGVTIVNTSRGGLIKTSDLVEGLASGKIRGAGLDVVEGEETIFFMNKEGTELPNRDLLYLTSSGKVLLTSHQAFLTEESLEAISTVTLNSIKEFADGKDLTNVVKPIA